MSVRKKVNIFAGTGRLTSIKIIKKSEEMRGTREEWRSSRTVTDLWEVKLGEVPPLQAVRRVGDVAGDRRLTFANRGS